MSEFEFRSATHQAVTLLKSLNQITVFNHKRIVLSMKSDKQKGPQQRCFLDCMLRPKTLRPVSGSPAVTDPNPGSHAHVSAQAARRQPPPTRPGLDPAVRLLYNPFPTPDFPAWLSISPRPPAPSLLGAHVLHGPRGAAEAFSGLICLRAALREGASKKPKPRLRFPDRHPSPRKETQDEEGLPQTAGRKGARIFR